MVNEGEANPALAPVVEKLTVGQKKNSAQLFDIQALIPKEMARFRLNGSLTTPPCSENGKRTILKPQFKHVKHKLPQ